MNKTPLNFTLALVVARDLTKSGKPHYVTYSTGEEQHICSLNTETLLSYVGGKSCGQTSLRSFHFDWADESVRIVRRGPSWETATPMKGWQIHAETERRLNRARDPLRAKIDGRECEYRDGEWRLVDEGHVYCSYVSEDYSIQWPTEYGDWEDVTEEDVTEEALRTYVDMVGGK